MCCGNEFQHTILSHAVGRSIFWNYRLLAKCTWVFYENCLRTIHLGSLETSQCHFCIIIIMIIFALCKNADLVWLFLYTCTSIVCVLLHCLGITLFSIFFHDWHVHSAANRKLVFEILISFFYCSRSWKWSNNPFIFAKHVRICITDKVRVFCKEQICIFSILKKVLFDNGIQFMTSLNLKTDSEFLNKTFFYSRKKHW